MNTYCRTCNNLGYVNFYGDHTACICTVGKDLYSNFSVKDKLKHSTMSPKIYNDKYKHLEDNYPEFGTCDRLRHLVTLETKLIWVQWWSGHKEIMTREELAEITAQPYQFLPCPSIQEMWMKLPPTLPDYALQLNSWAVGYIDSEEVEHPKLNMVFCPSGNLSKGLDTTVANAVGELLVWTLYHQLQTPPND